MTVQDLSPAMYTKLSKPIFVEPSTSLQSLQMSNVLSPKTFKSSNIYFFAGKKRPAQRLPGMFIHVQIFNLKGGGSKLSSSYNTTTIWEIGKASKSHHQAPPACKRIQRNGWVSYWRPTPPSSMSLPTGTRHPLNRHYFYVAVF